jgi:hypothetical protein
MAKSSGGKGPGKAPAGTPGGKDKGKSGAEPKKPPVTAMPQGAKAEP